MNDSERFRFSNSPQMLYDNDTLLEEEQPESCYWTQIDNPTQLMKTSSKNTPQAHFSTQAFEQYCTLESGSNPGQNSSSSLSFSSNESPSETNNSLSPLSHSCQTDESDDLRHKIRELETAMLGSDPHLPDPYQCQLASQDAWNETLEMVSRADLRGLLCACARAIEDNDVLRAEWLISELRQMVSVSGDPLQRLGAYMVEGIVARLAFSGSLICKALHCKEPISGPGTELLSYMHLLYELCPYFKFGYMSANGAIAEALKNEPFIHIVDFMIVQGSQWAILIRALSTRPGGPPQIRITGVDDATSASARGGGLSLVGARLSSLAKACNVPFEFNPVEVNGSDFPAHEITTRPGEALAVNFAMALHHSPDSQRDRILRTVKKLNPKIVTVVEQEADTNGAPFYKRVLETMGYYLPVFESIDATALPRDHKERISVEQHCLARDVVNLIACEGLERVERHELFGKWRERFSAAGFRQTALSPLVNATIRALLVDYNDKYSIEEREGALCLGWVEELPQIALQTITALSAPLVGPTMSSKSSTRELSLTRKSNPYSDPKFDPRMEQTRQERLLQTDDKTKRFFDEITLSPLQEMVVAWNRRSSLPSTTLLGCFVFV